MLTRAVDPIISEVFAALDTALGGETAPLGVAVSGGGDSMALLHLADAWATARGRALEVATVDHGLRAESAAEARLVGGAAGALGRPHEALEWRGWAGRGNLQAEARAARRRLLSAWAARRGLAAIALGHTMDDQAETVLLRLGRGAGVDGLSAMAARAEAAGAIWLRPLLGIRRAALRDWLRGRGVAWIEDPSNEDMRFDRVRARRSLSALAPLGVTAEGLSATAERMRGAREALDHGAAALAAKAAQWGACGELRLALPPLRAAPRELARRLLRSGLTRAAGAEYGPRAEAEAQLMNAMFAYKLGGGRSLHGCLIRPDGPLHVVISREEAAVDAAPAPLGAEGLIWDGRFLVAITPSADDECDAAVAPLGEAGARRLAELSGAGLWRAPQHWAAAPRAARLTTPALWRGGKLKAAPLAEYGAGATARFMAAGDGWPAACGAGG
ncbi:tRNA lysidine(34) synthetase TilS [Pikeienuella piscinae]|uniref:tRNA(Ile)-lysidine synthase n=1 Tax=Pikeienuella piscinae TaxID=2748098 RepID=A0A7L5BTG2_9RHOB|nr:tRNA lysidine(34) synthetase TilS [Pikeienuella piscinae]QIE55300.1 tRNA lysidine(34) synthetase TilS [Pikeienuella piscinae]